MTLEQLADSWTQAAAAHETTARLAEVAVEQSNRGLADEYEPDPLPDFHRAKANAYRRAAGDLRRWIILNESEPT